MGLFRWKISVLAKPLEAEIRRDLMNTSLWSCVFPYGFEADTAQVGQEAISLLE